jgi:alkylhydroperoxidase/carboxymuconolactone decarboxylase family protein YurZ
MNPMEIFQKESPEVAEAFDELIEALKATKGLDNKTKQLIYIALQASLGNPAAIYYHVPMAKRAGASREEVKGAILVTLTICGLNGVTSCLPTALEIYDKP